MSREFGRFEIPQTQDLSILNESQRQYAGELIKLLDFADNEIFSPNWRQRISWFNSLPSPQMTYGVNAEFGNCIALAACESARLDFRDTKTVLKKFASTIFGIDLSIIANYSQEPRELTSWMNKAKQGLSEYAIVQKEQPDFVLRLYMLGTEYTGFSLMEGLNEIKDGIQASNVLFYIGAEEAQGEKIYDQPDLKQKELLGSLKTYKLFKDINLQPVDPENLVGMVAHVMRQTGIIP